MLSPLLPELSGHEQLYSSGCVLESPEGSCSLLICFLVLLVCAVCFVGAVDVEAAGFQDIDDAGGVVAFEDCCRVGSVGESVHVFHVDFPFDDLVHRFT